MIETRTYSAMLYALADEIDRKEGCVTESAETVREAAERMDTQTVKINVLKKQRDELLEVMYRVEEDLIVGKSDDLTLAASIGAAIATVKRYGQPEKPAKNETSVPAIVSYPTGSLGEVIDSEGGAA